MEHLGGPPGQLDPSRLLEHLGGRLRPLAPSEHPEDRGNLFPLSLL